MSRADPALKDRELAGLAGMLCWGVPSSIVLVLTLLAIDLSRGVSDAGVIVLIGLPIGLVLATAAWGIGGLFVALPLWTILVRMGFRGRMLRWIGIGIGALGVGGLWGCFLWQTSTADLVATMTAAAVGALSGALGGYGFCRSAMRS